MDPRILVGALLWARNHIDAGVHPELRQAILARLDAILDAADPSCADLQALQAAFPAPVSGPRRPRAKISPNS